MQVFSPEQLLLQNKPEQIVLLEELLALFSQSRYLSHAFVRGSITRNALDRASDLDLVVAFDADYYQSMVERLDTLLAENLNVLFPGWQDSIVADFGGLGFVYILEREGTLYQLDVYILPTDAVGVLTQQARVKLIFRRELDRDVPTAAKSECANFITEYRNRNTATLDSLVGAMVLALLIRKRIKRGQQFLNYSESHLLVNAIRNFLRSVSDPKHIAYGWYHLQENLQDSDSGQLQLAFLTRLVSQAPIHSTQSLRETMVDFLDFIREITPDLHKEYQLQLTCFYRQLGFLTASEAEAHWKPS